MGNICGAAISAEERQALARSKAIEEQSRKAADDDRQKVKLLLLGAGESGKSTLFKQMRILYSSNKGFTDEEKKSMKPIIHQNILFNIQNLLLAKWSPGGLMDSTADTTEVKQLEDQICAVPLTDSFVLSKELEGAIEKSWMDKTTQIAWKRRGEFKEYQVQDALSYYMNHIERLTSADYIPSNDDILRSRVRTSGIVEEEFKMEDTKMQMVDVGGQRNERRKWIHAFDDVDTVIFVAAISEYNQYLFEDTSTNRQDESVDLFKQVSNDRTFQTNGLILFLNKSDLFREKLKKIPFRVEEGSFKRNEEYTGPTVLFDDDGNVKGNADGAEFEEVYLQTLQYLEQLYRKQAPKSKNVYVKVTCATDTEQVKHIMTACREIFLKKNLQSVGFM